MANARKYKILINSIKSNGLGTLVKELINHNLLEPFTILDGNSYVKISIEELQLLSVPEYITRVTDFLTYLNVDNSVKKDFLINTAQYDESYCNTLTTTRYVPRIGDSYQGGIVFYKTDTYSGLISMATDGPTGLIWGCTNIIVGTAQRTAIGTGKQNTQDIIDADCNESPTAALYCYNLNFGGYNDWYLPSKDELNEMYSQRLIIGGFTTNMPYYWTSTETHPYETLASWMQNFIGGYQGWDDKNTSEYKVRAIRSF